MSTDTEYDCIFKKKLNCYLYLNFMTPKAGVMTGRWVVYQFYYFILFLGFNKRNEYIYRKNKMSIRVKSYVFKYFYYIKQNNQTVFEVFK